MFKKIFEQTYKNFEVVIVDNNSNDRTVLRAKKYPVKIVKVNDFFPGKAINLGIRKSKGKIIICLSAHCIPVNNDWLKRLIFDLKNKKVAGVYGMQKPLSFSSDFDKRDLLNLFGQDKKVQKKRYFFFIMLTVLLEEKCGKSFCLMKKQNILKIEFGHIK